MPTAMDIHPNDCHVSFNVQDDDENPQTLKIITVMATHPAHHGPVASIEAVKILRRFCKGQFLDVMDEESDEMHQFSVALFDKFGKVKPFLISEGHRSGTGCWGEELNTGELIYIKDINVNDPYRGKGVGSWILKQFLTSHHVGPSDTVICWPTPSNQPPSQEEWKAIQNRQISFLRKNHFRRIGRTSFFGYSPNPSHPSRSVSADADPESAEALFTQSVGPASATDQAQAFPLHFALINLPRSEVPNAIRSFHAVDSNLIHKQDQDGFTLLYLAAAQGNAPAVSTLLELGAASDLNNYANKEGMTPLERIDETMRSEREFSETLLQQWDGYSGEQLAVQAMLTRALGVFPEGMNDETYAEKKKWGCTCDQCTDGWLSPRMRFRLDYESALCSDVMRDCAPLFRVGELLDDLLPPQFDSIPEHVRANMTKTFYFGFINLFKALNIILRDVNKAPTISDVQALAYRDTSAAFYFGKGGKVEYAIDALVNSTEEASSLIDGTFEELYEDENETDDSFRRLPKCANDLEFGLVKRKMGGFLGAAGGILGGPAFGGGFGSMAPGDVALLRSLQASIAMQQDEGEEGDDDDDSGMDY